jgi:hypothetical protein
VQIAVHAIADGPQTFDQCRNPKRCNGLGPRKKKTDLRYLSGLLRARRERPSDGSAAEHRDELTSKREV